MRYLITVEYDGTNYVGWQKQTNGISVQEVLENALGRLFSKDTPCTAAGRTDAGVHALAQAVHFDADTSIPTEKIPFALNTLLPDDISVKSIREVPGDFNARYSAKKKTYRYSIYVSPHRLPLLERTHAHCVKPLDIDEMKKAAEHIKGEHDFSAFEAAGAVVKSKVRTIYSLNIEQKGNEVTITVTGNGFLYNMVRIIAGTLMYVGLHKLSADDVKTIIDSRDRTAAGKTLPAKGLMLVSVEYEI
ncbi:MAG: tRNA pseudouridine(38-40) synthase TruA [Clostridiales bacterium]|nr:tRNA pseudouridine(38-40) synthase TruA [Clostridiales bacterium]